MDKRNTASEQCGKQGGKHCSVKEGVVLNLNRKRPQDKALHRKTCGSVSNDLKRS